MVIEPCEASFGATVTGASLARLDGQEWSELEAAFFEYALLIVPAQHLDPEQQGAFARRFGPLEVALMGDRSVVEISNTGRSGEVRGPDHPVFHVLMGNEGWHTDSSYMPVSAAASVLSAVTVPSSGGATEWADMRAAYRALDPSTRRRLSGLSARHSLRYSQQRAGQAQTVGYGMDVEHEPLRPLVKVHPVTGVPALFIGRHAHDIEGLDEGSSRELLDRLVEDACQPPRTVQHQWQPGDLAVWDNRCLLHRAHPYDYREPRVMRHTRVAGDPSAEAGARRDAMSS